MTNIIVEKSFLWKYYASMKKTNAMRILDGLNISYETAEYEDDGEHELAKRRCPYYVPEAWCSA